jgi:hypothetical protein
MERLPVTVMLCVALCATGFGQATATTVPPTATATSSPQRPSEVEVYEAVLRYQIKSWDLNADSYCVKVGGKDASKTLLGRLQPLHVKSASGCKERHIASVMEIVDKKTGKLSVIFDMGKIHWLAPSNADVEGGYLCGTSCMAAGSYRVQWDGSGWVVIEFRKDFQS